MDDALHLSRSVHFPTMLRRDSLDIYVIPGMGCQAGSRRFSILGLNVEQALDPFVVLTSTVSVTSFILLRCLAPSQAACYRLFA